MIKAIVKRWIDGDTLIADIQFFNAVTLTDMKVRIMGIDAPEIKGYTMYKGLVSKAFCESKWPPGSQLNVIAYDSNSDRYNRLILTLTDDNGSIAEQIVNAKMAIYKIY